MNLTSKINIEVMLGIITKNNSHIFVIYNNNL